MRSPFKGLTTSGRFVWSIFGTGGSILDEDANHDVQRRALLSRSTNLDGVQSHSFDDRTLTLEITLPASGFESTDIETARRSTLPPQSGRGAFLDYDALFS